MNFAAKLERLKARVNSAPTVQRRGIVARVAGIVVEATGPALRVGDQVVISTTAGEVPGEVVGFKAGKIFVTPFGELAGIGPGDVVTATGHPVMIPVGPELLGRVLDGLGRPIDGQPPADCHQVRPVQNNAPMPMQRKRITEPFYTGIRAIDCFITCGLGQRMTVLSGSGVGKSVLLGMIARSSSADVNVIGLIGERGREVRDFLERDLGPAGLAKSVVVVVTSDSPPLLRIKGILTATTIAEFFRDQGKSVALLIDSLTRVATAQREIGLSIGEPPTTRGYTPSVFSLLPKVLERAGQSDRGSITGFYAVLVEGDDLAEPIGDATRAIVDGHIVLSRQLATRHHYPAIDVLESISRLMPDIVSREHLDIAARCRQVLADYRDAEDLINIGAYVRGSSPRIDFALSRIDPIMAFLRQDITERSNCEEALARLKAILDGTGQDAKV